MDIAIDFDGTIVTHEYPNIGEDIPNALPVIKKLIKFGHNIILNTMRSGSTLVDAVQYLEQNDIKLYGINNHPTQSKWTTSPKVYAQLYIDDAALGCPLVHIPGRQLYVDWVEVEKLLIKQGYIQ